MMWSPISPPRFYTPPPSFTLPPFTPPLAASPSEDIEMGEAERKIEEDQEEHRMVDVVSISPNLSLTPTELFRASIDDSHPVHKLADNAARYWNCLADHFYREVESNTDWREALKTVAIIQRRAMKVTQKSKFMPGQTGYFLNWIPFFLECNGDGSITKGAHKAYAVGSSKIMQISKDIMTGKIHASLLTSYTVEEYQFDLENKVLMALQETPGIVQLKYVLRNLERIPFEDSKGELIANCPEEVLKERKIFEKFECTLYDYLKVHPNYFVQNEREFLLLMKQFGTGVYQMHEKNIIHRDLKPSNLLLKQDGVEGVITDFGSAVFLDETSLDRKTRVSNAEKMTRHRTTVWYLSKEYSEAFMMEKADEDPERLNIYRDDHNQFVYYPEKLKAAATKSSDVCSLGYIFFEMRYGALPWARDYRGPVDDYTVMVKIASLAADWFPHPVKEGVLSIEGLIRWMTRPQVDDRPNMSQVMLYLALLQKKYDEGEGVICSQ